jgi:hypothetical protein
MPRDGSEISVNNIRLPTTMSGILDREHVTRLAVNGGSMSVAEGGGEETVSRIVPALIVLGRLLFYFLPSRPSLLSHDPHPTTNPTPLFFSFLVVVALFLV